MKYRLIHFRMDKQDDAKRGYLPFKVETVESAVGITPTRYGKAARCYIDTRTEYDGQRVYHVFHYDYT